MEDIKKTKLTTDHQADQEALLELGSWLGRRQAFGLVANRCTAADAECLKMMRDRAEYQKLGLNWEEFCQQKAGISRRHADRLIGQLEEFGSNYFRMAELMEISGDTYRLIAGAVSEDGLEYKGEKIPLTPGNRKQVMAAGEKLRENEGARTKPPPSAQAIHRRAGAIFDEAKALTGTERLVLIGPLPGFAKKL